MAEYKQLKYTADEINRGLAAATAVGDLAQSRANALKNQVSNEIIQIDDCAPFEHEMSVKVRGKNLINMSTVTIPNGQSYSYENGIATISQGTYVYVPRARWDFFDVSMFEGKTVTVSLDVTEDQGTNTKGNILYIQGISNKEYSLKTLGFTQTGKITLTYTFADKLDYDKIRIMLYAEHLKDASESLSFTNVQFEMGSTATAYAPYIEDISTVKVKKYGKNLYNAANWTTAPYYSFCSIGNFPWRLTLLDKDTSVDMSGIQVGVGQYSASNLKAFSAAFYNGTIRWATKDNIATHPDSVAGKNLLCEYLYIYPNTQEALDKVLQRFDFMVTGVNIIPTEYEPYIEPTEYPVNTDGIVDGVISQTSVMTLMGDTLGAILDVEYNQDVNKWRDKISTAAIMLGGL